MVIIITGSVHSMSFRAVALAPLVCTVYSGDVNGDRLYESDGHTFSNSRGLRPVVSLNSNVKVTEDGTLSM